MASSNETAAGAGPRDEAGKWVLRLPVMPERPWLGEGPGPGSEARHAASGRRMRVLGVLPSTRRPDRGAGQALGELVASTLDRIEWELAIDDADAGAVDSWSEFARGLGIGLHVGRHGRREGELEPVNRDLSGLLRGGCWDAVELVGATQRVSNLTAIEALAARSTMVVYTPHIHELARQGLGGERLDSYLEAHGRILRRADLVLADTPAERDQWHRQDGGRNVGVHLPAVGCDFEAYRPGMTQRPARLVFAGGGPGDASFGRVLEAFGHLVAEHAHYQLIVLGGCEGDAAGLSTELLTKVRFLGSAASDAALSGVLREARGLIVGAESDAHWKPTAAALATGTPVILPRTADLETIHGERPGVVWCEPGGVAEMEAALRALVHDPARRIGECVAGRDTARCMFDRDRVASERWGQLSAAWTRKNVWLWTA